MSSESCFSCGKPTTDCTCPGGGHEEGIVCDGIYYPYVKPQVNQGGYGSSGSSSGSSGATPDGTSEELSSTHQNEKLTWPITFRA
ncbi:uncharacterized protein PpBr36_06585 [Pyricularia pennisetigena]|uniref:uncharacterized protein n=1 Tax=Pyricularia pennisetigena TaxID=1578925 RepID=UPI00114EA877|nr:uncharacterized protein PpBr36_06585 [Pyricularia pennisetigena]TLS23582.1 hypothetical protein PpBr36_06585 [Pyricularia pennisetigena]